MQDSKILWHKAEEQRDEAGNVLAEAKDWHTVELHATDAMHALAVDPDHWSVEKPDSAVEAEPAEPAETKTEIKDGEHE